MRRRRRLSALAATALLVAAMMVASAPPAFAEDGGCENGQNQAFVNAWLKQNNEEQTLQHLYMFVLCEIGQPPGGVQSQWALLWST